MSKTEKNMTKVINLGRTAKNVSGKTIRYCNFQSFN
eukprot:07916.XXX_431213_431320_1 [CDS] Oithona nana genome sequencing.